MSAITKHNEEINEKRQENMRKIKDHWPNQDDVVLIYVEPKYKGSDFTFFTGVSNRHTYSYSSI